MDKHLKEKLTEVAKNLKIKGIGYRNNDKSMIIDRFEEVINKIDKEVKKEVLKSFKSLYGVDDLFSFVKKQFPKVKNGSDLKGVLLTNSKGVLKHHRGKKTTVMSAYLIPDDSLIVSDFGEEGVLFVTDKDPEELYVGKFEYKEKD